VDIALRHDPGVFRGRTINEKKPRHIDELFSNLLTRACSRQAGVGQSSGRARRALWPDSGSINLCGREPDRLQLMRKL